MAKGTRKRFVDPYAGVALADAFSTRIVGMEFALKSYEKRLRVVLKLRVGDSLEIRRERGNEHDPNACAIYMGKTRLGYLPRRMAELVAKDVDQGAIFDLFVIDREISDLNLDQLPTYKVVGIKKRGKRATRPGSSRKGKAS